MGFWANSSRQGCSDAAWPKHWARGSVLGTGYNLLKKALGISGCKLPTNRADDFHRASAMYNGTNVAQVALGRLSIAPLLTGTNFPKLP